MQCPTTFTRAWRPASFAISRSPFGSSSSWMWWTWRWNSRERRRAVPLRGAPHEVCALHRENRYDLIWADAEDTPPISAAVASKHIARYFWRSFKEFIFVSYKLFEKVFELASASYRERDYHSEPQVVLSGNGPFRTKSCLHHLYAGRATADQSIRPEIR